jgi:hypothetical protein
MRITPVALLVTLAASVLACAEGTGTLSPSGDPGDPPPAAASTHTATSPPSRPSAPAGTVAPQLAPASTEVPGEYSLDVACSDIPVLDLCLIDGSADRNVTFTLPDGTHKSSIQYDITPHGPDAGGTVDWASTDPLDGTVHMRGFAHAFSSVHIEVSGIEVVPD